MLVYCVSVQVKPGHEEDFRTATGINRLETMKEKGVLRFDVLQSQDDPSRFMLYEVYRSEEAVAAHRETPHYLKWRSVVAPWMARDRQGEKFKPLYPEGDMEW